MRLGVQNAAEHQHQHSYHVSPGSGDLVERDAQELYQLCLTRLVPDGQDAAAFWHDNPSPCPGFSGPLGMDQCRQIVCAIPCAKQRRAWLDDPRTRVHVIAGGLKPRSKDVTHLSVSVFVPSGAAKPKRLRPSVVQLLHDKLVEPVESTETARWTYCEEPQCIIHATHAKARPALPLQAAVVTAPEPPAEPDFCVVCMDSDLNKCATFACQADARHVICMDCAVRISFTCEEPFQQLCAKKCAWSAADGATLRCPSCRSVHTNLPWKAAKSLCHVCESNKTLADNAAAREHEEHSWDSDPD